MALLIRMMKPMCSQSFIVECLVSREAGGTWSKHFTTKSC